MAEQEIDDGRIAAVCAVLIEHGVEFVVIGGVAARLHDTRCVSLPPASPTATTRSYQTKS